MLALLTAALVAFCVVQTLTISESVRDQGAVRARELAAGQSQRVSEAVAGHRRVLDELAGHEGLRNLTRDQCPEVSLDIGAAALNVVDRDGRVVCSSKAAFRPSGRGPDPAPYARSSWLTEQAEGTRFHFTPDAPLVGGAAVELVRAAGKNLLVIAFNVDAATEALDLAGAGAEQTVTLVDGRGHVLVTDPPAAPGEDLDDLVDGVVRSPIFGAAPVPGTAWRVYVTLDWDDVAAGARPQLRNVYLAAGFVFVFACLLVAAVHLFVLRPLRRLDATMADAIEDGAVRADRRGPRELVDVAARFNTLLAARGAAQRTLSETIAQLVTVRETEKRNLAVSLHDDTIQAFVAARWFVGGLAADGSPEPTPEDLEQLLVSLDQGIATLRSQTFELMPPNLGELGLVSAVESLLDSTCVKAGLDGHLDHNVAEFTRLPGEAEMLAFRTIQEALRNVVKHANASRVWVSLVVRGDLLEVEVRDDGDGFAEDRLGVMADRSHLGVVSMRETVALAGGRFQLSSDATGTVASFSLPLARVNLPR